MEYFDNDFSWEEVAEQRKAKIDLVPITSKQVNSDNNIWETFYSMHKNKFFKPRNYIIQAFPELKSQQQNLHIAELGCGHGSTLIPISRHLPESIVSGVDISPTAVETLSNHLPRFKFSVGDISDSELNLDEGTYDFVFLVFTLSAVDPIRHAAVFGNAWRMLKPGGMLLFRDYGLYDMVQLRCKERISTRTYVKQDGVEVTFFSLEDMQRVCREMRFEVVRQKYCTVKNINRKKGIDIKRVFLTGVYRKIS